MRWFVFQFNPIRCLRVSLFRPNPVPPPAPPNRSQVMHYETEEIPEAKFNYDISPMSVVISSKRRAWYVCAHAHCGVASGKS